MIFLSLYQDYAVIHLTEENKRYRDEKTKERDEVFTAAQFIKGTKILSEKARQVRELENSESSEP